MRIVVTGTTGQVVSAILSATPSDVKVTALGRPDIDLADPGSLRGPIVAARPDIILSVAAYTAVDKAESEPDLAQAVNGVAPGVLAAIAHELGVPIIHLSTDYVFDGAKPEPYVEDDATGPLGVYGKSKLAGEMAVRAASDNHVILRTAWVYSEFGGNFVKTMLRLAENRDEVSVVADQRGCPTCAVDIARAVIAIARRLRDDASPTRRGTFHLSAPDDASWAEFAGAIFSGLAARAGKTVGVRAIATFDYPTPARRPVNSRLDGHRLAAVYGIKLPSWRTSLDTTLDRLLLGKDLT